MGTNLKIDDLQNKQFVRKMVTLVAQVVPLAEEKLTGNASAFLISFRGRHWLATAAHFAHALQVVHKAGRLLALYSCDAWTNTRGTGHGVPIPIDFASRWIILSDNHSYDVALLDLGTNLTAQIQAGGVQAFEESEWMSPPSHFDFYLLIGTPGETISANETRRRGQQGQEIIQRPDVYDVRRGVVELAAIARPDYVDRPNHDRLYARIVEVPHGQKVDEIEGVSGGPVFGCTRDGDSYTMQLVGLQSEWYKAHKTIVADFLNHLPHRFDLATQQ